MGGLSHGKVVVVEDVDPKIATVPWDGERVAVVPCRVRLVVDRPAGAHVGMSRRPARVFNPRQISEEIQWRLVVDKRAGGRCACARAGAFARTLFVLRHEHETHIAA